MEELEVVCIEKASRPNDCRCIQTIEVKDEQGEKAPVTPEEAYYLIESGTNVFIEDGNNRTYLQKATQNGTKYVRTKKNDSPDDNLLKQQIC